MTWPGSFEPGLLLPVVKPLLSLDPFVDCRKLIGGELLAMENAFEHVDIARHMNLIRDWLTTNVLTWATLLEFSILIVAAAVSHLVSSRISAPIRRRVEELRIPPALKRVIGALSDHARSIMVLAILWLVIGIADQAGFLDARVLRLFAILITAWVAISLSSLLIRNRAIAKSLAVIAWIVAALSLTDLLDPALAALDGFAFTIAAFRLSLLGIIKGVLALIILLWVATVIARVLETRIQRIPDITPSVQVLLGKLLKITLLGLAVILALNMIGVDLTGLALLSGAIGLGIGFGLQKIVSNLISGVILLLDKSIKPGDVIEIEETFGWISGLGARYVSVVTRDGKEYLIPNEDLITHRVVNWSYTNQLVRLEIKFGVGYGSDPHMIRKLAREAAGRPARVLSDPAPVCHLSDFGESSLDFLLRFWIRDPQDGVANIRGEVMLELWDTFKNHDIKIPYPHRQIIIESASADPVLAPSSG